MGAAPPDRRARRRVFEWLGILAARGLGSVAFPEEYGGRGDVAGSITSSRRWPSSTCAYSSSSACSSGSSAERPLSRHPASPRALPARRHRLELPGCFAMTETGHGSNVGASRRRRRTTREAGVRHPHADATRRKDWIGNAARTGDGDGVRAADVSGEEHGVHAFLVPIRDERGNVDARRADRGLRPEVGLNGVDNGRIWFDNVRIPRENLLDRFGAVAKDGSYSSPIESPAGASSPCSARWSRADQRRRRRRQRGQNGAHHRDPLRATAAASSAPPGSPRSSGPRLPRQQRRLLPALATTYALDFAQRSSSRSSHECQAPSDPDERDAREVETLAAGLKASPPGTPSRTSRSCREACGGRATSRANRFGELKADTDVFTTFEGDNTVLLQLVAKPPHRVPGGARRAPALGRAAPPHPAEPRSASPSEPDRHPPDRRRRTSATPTSIAAALRYREERLLITAARRLQRPHRRWQSTPSRRSNETQDHLVALALAHVERVVLERFQAASRRCRRRPELTRADHALATSSPSPASRPTAAGSSRTGYLEPPSPRRSGTWSVRCARRSGRTQMRLVDGFGLGVGIWDSGDRRVRSSRHPTPNAQRLIMSPHRWFLEHDDRYTFIAPYVALSVFASVFVSLFWLAALIGVHFGIELYRQRHLAGRQTFAHAACGRSSSTSRSSSSRSRSCCIWTSSSGCSA